MMHESNSTHLLVALNIVGIDANLLLDMTMYQSSSTSIVFSLLVLCNALANAGSLQGLRKQKTGPSSKWS
jgi:hypothetical protein